MSFISAIIIISIRSDLFSEQAQYGRPPGIKDVLYDDRGNVVAVMKISPEKLPSHRYVAYPSRVILVHQLSGGGGEEGGGGEGGCMAHLKENKKMFTCNCKEKHVSMVINLLFFPILSSILDF